MKLKSSGGFSLAAIAVAIIFLALAAASSYTHRPQIDEGMFASPADNLANHGFFGTTVLETDQSPLTRIEQRTYWVMPLFLLNVAAVFKAVGTSVFTMRLVNVFWGLILLWATWSIAQDISSGNRRCGLFALFLVAGNYTILDTASAGRMDMMSAALGFAGIAAYLHFREQNLPRAVIIAQTFVALSGLTHPNGILAFAGLLFLTLFLDFRRLNLRLVGLAAIPYLIGGAAFGWWVFQDKEAFMDQFVTNATMSGRMEAGLSPLSSIWREFTERYPHAHGLQAVSGGHSGPVFLKSLILIGYITGIIGMLAIAPLRRAPKSIALLFVTLIYFVLMSLIDGQKETPYLVHIVPLYCIMLALVLDRLMDGRMKLVAVGALTVFTLIGAGGIAFRVRLNTYARLYQPTIEYLKSNAVPDDLIMAPSDIGFGLGFSKNHVDDGRFAFYTGKRPRFIVTDDAVMTSWRESEKFFPAFYEYFPKLLADEYRVVFENAAYKIYERKQ